MSCCSNVESRPTPPPVSGTGSFKSFDPEHPLAWAIRNSLPPAGTVYGRPTIHDDGSIEYAPVDAPPPTVKGFETDPSNPWLLRPLWPGCQARMTGVGKLKDGTLTLKMVCQQREAKHFGRLVAPSDCQGCPFRVPPEMKH